MKKVAKEQKKISTRKVWMRLSDGRPIYKTTPEKSAAFQIIQETVRMTDKEYEELVDESMIGDCC